MFKKAQLKQGLGDNCFGKMYSLYFYCFSVRATLTSRIDEFASQHLGVQPGAHGIGYVDGKSISG